MLKPSQKGWSVNPDTLLRLNTANWGKIYPALVLYARFKARSLCWRSGNMLDLTKGMNPEDIVNEAIRKVYEGERVWDPIKMPDLLEFLKSSTLASMFNELAQSADNRLVQRFSEPQDINDTLGDRKRSLEPNGGVLHRRDSPLNPEEQRLAQESEQQAKEIFSELKSSTTRDAELQAILECIMDDVTAPGQIAERKGLPIYKVYAGQNRLRRVLTKGPMKNQSLGYEIE